MIQFLVNIRPKPQQRHRSRGKYFYDPSVQDKKTFITLIKRQIPKKPLLYPFDMHITFCYKRPKNQYRTKNKKLILKDDVPYYKSNKPDIDNLIKFYMDCMNGLVYKDDAQVVSINAQKVYGSKDYIHIKLFHKKKYCK